MPPDDTSPPAAQAAQPAIDAQSPTALQSPAPQAADAHGAPTGEREHNRVAPGLIRRWPGLSDPQMRDGKAVYVQRPGRLLMAIPVYAVAAVLGVAFASGSASGDAGSLLLLAGAALFALGGLTFVLQRGRIVIDPTARTVAVDWGLYLMRARSRTIAAGEIESVFARPFVLVRKSYDMREMAIVTLKLHNGDTIEIIATQRLDAADELVARLKELLARS